MLVEMADRLVERHLRQRAFVDGGGKVGVVLEVLLSIRLARREAREVVERLVMRLEGLRARLEGIDDAALLARVAPAIPGRVVPAAAVPGPGDAFRRKRVADRLLGRRRQR